jgi:hypothetical protein
MADIETYEAARDAVLDKFKAAWDAGTPALNGGTVPTVEWPNVDPVDPPLTAGNVPWARVTVKHSAGGQATLGETGGRRFSRVGTVTVQIFVPAAKRGLVTGDRLGNVALSAFEGERSEDVWFSDVVMNEIGVDGAWHQTNVSATSTYEVVK